MSERTVKYEKKAEELWMRIHKLEKYVTIDKPRTQENLDFVKRGLRVYDLMKDRGDITPDNEKVFAGKLMNIYEARVYAAELELASERQTPEDILGYLAETGDRDVVDAVMRNPSTSEFTLSRYLFAESDSPERVYNILSNPSVNNTALLYAANNRDFSNEFRHMARIKLVERAIKEQARAKKSKERRIEEYAR